MSHQPPDDATLMRAPAAPAGATPNGAPPDSVLPGDIAPLAVGERVGPYEVREHLGDGGMASVYRAWHTGLHRFEALKVPRQQGRYGPEAAFVRRLLAEARTVAGLHHPHIALIHAVSETDSPLQYFAMELVDGGDLAQLIHRKGKLAPAEALPILQQIAAALDYAHSNGVVHRDIKPANVLLTGDGTAKVVDFGISRAGEEAGGTRLTRSGMIVGTPEYMSPEQSGSGDPVTHRTDIYSLGVVAYEMLCGTPPFVAGDGVNRLSILMKHLGEAPASPLRRAPDFGAAATEALLTALAKKPEERFATCGEFVAALTRALQKPSHTQILAAGSTVENDSAARPVTRSLSARAPESLIQENELRDAKRDLPIPRPVARHRPGALLTAVSALVLGVLTLLGWWQSNGTKVIVSSTPTPLVPSQPVALQRPAPQPTVTTPIATKPVAPKPNRVETRIVTQRRSLAFARRTRPDSTLARGQKRIVQQGQNGVRETRLEIRLSGIRELSRRVLSSRVVRAPRDEITATGTRVPQARASQAKKQPIISRRSATSPSKPLRSIPQTNSVRRLRPSAFSQTRSRKTSTKRAAPRRTTPRRTTRQAAQRQRSRSAPTSRRPSYTSEAPLPP